MGTEEFAVTEDYQAKLLAFMLHNNEFRDVASGALDKEQFSNKALQWFFDRLSSKELSPTLLQEEMIKAARNKEIKQDDVTKYVNTFDVIKAAPLPVEETYIREKMQTFIRTQAVKKSFLDALAPGGLVQQGDWDAIAEIVAEATQAGFDLQDMGYDYFNQLATRIHERAHRKKRRRIQTGIPELDSMTYGGIKNKQAGLIVGGTGRGKSVFMQWLARVALLLGKRVIYFTMELDQDQIADRFDSMFARVRPHELNEYQQDVLNEVGKYTALYGGNLIIKHFPMDQATVVTLRQFVKQLSNTGWIPDLVIVDYLDLLQPHRTYNDKIAEQDAVVKGLVGFAQEFDLALWTATQLNRGGLVMETPDESSQAGYIGRQYVMDIVLWLAQTKEEKEDEIMRMWISKNRNGIAGRVISLDTDYSYMTFYREAVEPEEENNVGSTTTEATEETADPAPEKRDLQLLLTESDQEHTPVPEQADGGEDMSPVPASVEPATGDNPEGSDPVPEV